MGILASAAYDPAVAVQKSAASLLAMTAIDTTNLRLAPVVPANGIVEVRARAALGGTTAVARITLGVLEASTVKLRQLAASPTTGASLVAGTNLGSELFGIITGLTPGAHTFDLAYGVELAGASAVLQYGGPNDTAGNDAFGACTFEFWDTANVLAAVSYDPGTAATASMTSLLAMTALDTTNLRLTFTAPSDGDVYWKARCGWGGATVPGQALLGILESTTVVARAVPQWVGGMSSSTASGVLEASGVVTGVSAGSHTWDAAYGVQVVSGAGGGLKWGGPNDTTQNNAWGAFTFMLWQA